jgi:hypothetical protein
VSRPNRTQNASPRCVSSPYATRKRKNLHAFLNYYATVGWSGPDHVTKHNARLSEWRKTEHTLPICILVGHGLHYSFECDKFGSICVTDRFVTFLFDRGMFFFLFSPLFPSFGRFPTSLLPLDQSRCLREQRTVGRAVTVPRIDPVHRSDRRQRYA